MKTGKIAVIGGGAAGLMAALTAAEKGASVTVFEHNEKTGKKLLGTGNGRCNYTNSHISAACYGSRRMDQVKKVLDCFSGEDAVRLFKKLGVWPQYRGNLVYPYSDQALAVAEALYNRCKALSVRLCCDSHVDAVGRNRQGTWTVAAGSQEYAFDKVIIAAGSKASNISGSDGSGYEIAASLGHPVVPVLPALVQLVSKDRYMKGCAGIRCQGRVQLLADGRTAAEDTGELQLTDYGISGIPVFQVSRHASQALWNGCRVEARLNFLPAFSHEEGARFLKARADLFAHGTMEQYFNGLLHKKLAQFIIKKAGFRPQTPVEDLQKYGKRLWDLVLDLPVPIVGTKGFENAQVCAGGVDLSQIACPSMESRLHKGLYFAGEILDADGVCGGFNLHWAWATGYLAGSSAADRETGNEHGTITSHQ